MSVPAAGEEAVELDLGTTTVAAPVASRRVGSVELARDALGHAPGHDAASVPLVHVGAALWLGLLGRLTGTAVFPVRVGADRRVVAVRVDETRSLLQLAADVGAGAWSPLPDRATVVGVIVEREGAASHAAGVAGCALAVAVSGDASGVRLELLVDAGSCSDALAALLFRRLQHAAVTWGAAPLMRAMDFDPLPPAERREITQALRPVATPPAAYPDVVALIVEQAQRAPARVALECGGVSLTYEEFVARARRIAAALAANGVRPGDRVAVCAPRSAAQIVGIVGVQLAGAAYVPIDPGYPQERIRLLLDDAAPSCVLVQRGTAGIARWKGAAVELAPDGELAVASDAASALPSPDPDAGAYVIYTSGSTGRPKGVVVTRANLAYSTDARFRFYGGAPNRFLLLPSFAFDSSVAGIFWTLAGGGTLVVPDDELARDAGGIATLVDSAEISDVLLLPSLYSAVLRSGARTVPAHPTLRRVVVAGEECPSTLTVEHARTLPHARFFNEYGPTECTVWATACEPGEVPRGPVPIGSPIPGARCHVRDAAGRAVGVGVPGELFVAGPGVARGYLNRADLTAERFVPEPPGADTSARAYRTGDLVRLNPAGLLEFLGRTDSQIKLRGFRIEPGEIEAALRAHPALGDAVVGVHGAPEPMLVAWATRSRAPGDPSVGEISEAELLAELNVRLPAHLVPSRVVILDALPLLPNGKVDRGRLPVPPPVAVVASEAGPSSLLEEVVLQIWSDVLGTPVRGVHESFFALGGHSLLAAIAVARVRETFAAEVPLLLLFQHPSARAFCVALEADPVRAAQIATMLAQFESTPELPA